MNNITKYDDYDNKKINYDELCKISSKKFDIGNSLINDKEQINEKKKLKRRHNTEEHSFFLLNIFYIFFLRYICRIRPVSDEDIPECDSHDYSEKCYNKTKNRWENEYSKYFIELEKYNTEKAKNLKYIYIYSFYLNNNNIFFINRMILKEPKLPGLISVLISSLKTPSLVLSLILEAFAVAAELLQPFLMKELLKVIIKKGIYETAKDSFSQISDLELAAMGIEMPSFPYGWIISIILCPFLVYYFYYYFI
jgi:hypothetical protein